MHTSIHLSIPISIHTSIGYTSPGYQGFSIHKCLYTYLYTHFYTHFYTIFSAPEFTRNIIISQYLYTLLYTSFYTHSSIHTSSSYVSEQNILHLIFYFLPISCVNIPIARSTINKRARYFSCCQPRGGWVNMMPFHTSGWWLTGWLAVPHKWHSFLLQTLATANEHCCACTM